MALFTAYKSSPELFGRTHDIRHGQARAALKKETGMTDEAIEGWAIMLLRDPRRMRKLEQQVAGAFDGRQEGLASSAYRGGGSDTEEGEDGAGGAVRGGFRGRGRGRGGMGRVGNVAGDKGEPSTAQAQRRKEASKSSRANHNRRNQRAKKMARGGFPG
jgi:activating signal cointegrator complex subunit 2